MVGSNDRIADTKGGVYFTDPANTPNPSLPPAVYDLPPSGGTVLKVVDNVNPNGVSRSPDKKTLYVNSGGTGPPIRANSIRQGGGSDRAAANCTSALPRESVTWKWRPPFTATAV